MIKQIFKKIAVVYGGPSNEAEVSQKTAKAVFNSLEKLGYNSELIEFDKNISSKLTDGKFDCVYNAMHGQYGEDGCLAGLLEVIQIPYTHSGVLSSAYAMNKSLTKQLLESYDVQSPKGWLMNSKELKSDISSLEEKLPIVIKPVDEGSSVNLFIVKTKEDLEKVEISNDNIEYLVEEFIEGKEISIAVLDGKALGTVEIRPKSGVYDYHSKYTLGATEYIVPAEIAEPEANTAMKYAEIAHNTLKCTGVSRSDVLVTNSSEVYFLEINTHPGMTESSLVPKIANKAGISFEQLVEKILATAKLENSGK